jgi:hypothetical protein
MAFACSTGNLDLPAPIPSSDACSMESDSSSSSSMSSSDESDGENSSIKEKTTNETCLPAPPLTDLLPETDFPFLHSLGIHKESQLNTIIQEIVKYRGNTIEFTQRKNQPGFLLFCPSSRSTHRYGIEFSKKGGTINSFLGAISRSINLTEREALECLL